MENKNILAGESKGFLYRRDFGNLMRNTNESEYFKGCSYCKLNWMSRDDFLSDPDIKLIGYQPHYKNMEEGLFLFNHLGCNSTLSIVSQKFRDLYTGPLYTSSKLEDDKLNYDDCPDFCLFKNKMKGCLQQCERAFVSEIIQVITIWGKTKKVEESSE
jgi:hypothetical protein